MENLSSTLDFTFHFFTEAFNFVWPFIEPLTEAAKGASQLIGMFA